MLRKLVELSIRFRGAMLALLLIMLGGGVYAALRLPIDAVPDISTIQVSVLTEAPGRSSLEVERAITFPIENALNGVPGMVELRSVSRSGISSVTVIFKDGTNPWFARQLVLERVRQVEQDLPETAGKPELAPLSTGLGEIYQFVVRSDQHSSTQLRTILDWEIVPRLRSVPGLIEVNTMGGKLKQFHVVVDPAKMHAQHLTLGKVAEALRRANVNVGGGYVDRGAESLTLRGVGMLTGERDIETVVLKTDDEGTPVLVRHIAHVTVGSALPHGVITRDGEGEAVTGIVMMLLGSNSRDVVYAVKDRIREVQEDMPPGIIIDPIYDRADFVERTVRTVMTNLAEGALIVAVVLTLLLGTFRGALVAVVGIPASMAIAMFGMHAADVTGDLMSLGAIDFGFLVDGPIVVLEAVIAAFAGKTLGKRERAEHYARTIDSVVRPVAFSVAIIMLVYVPLLALEGVEGKMFRPMAITMAFALLGALVYSVLFLPGLIVMFVPPSDGHGGWLEALTARYADATVRAVQMRWRLLGAATMALAGSVVLLSRGGADFVPRIAEGDVVVTFRRPPSVNLEEAKRLDLAAEEILRRYPEVITTLAMTGRAEVAVEPVGKDATELFVRLKPPEEWTTAHDLDGISEVFKRAIEGGVPSTFVSVSQPIEDRTNELISGSRADVQINIFGPDLLELKRVSETVGDIVRDVHGTGDIRVERVLGAPELTVQPDRERLARYGVLVEDALAVVEAARIGLEVGWVYEGERRVGVRLLQPPRTPTAMALGNLFVESQSGSSVPLAEVAAITESEGPPQIRRENRIRGVRVDVNLRGRDLVSWVGEARANVDAAQLLASGYDIQWGGQFENFERASKRITVVASIALAIIFGMLVLMFQDVRYAAAVFATIPFALIGGSLGLFVRELPFSIPAAVGFIALAGVSVLNGVVMASAVRARLDAGVALDEALVEGATHTMRAVLTTGAVAALGFLPMALATSAGAEVQRPLATVVVFGIGLATLLTLFLFPGVLRVALRRELRARAVR